MKILIIVLSILFNSSYILAGDDDSSLSKNGYSKETQVLLTTLENKIIATVRELTDLQVKNDQETNGYHFDLSIAKKQDTNMGLVLDYAPRQKGYKVLSVSPGSNAEQIGIKPQDIILKINDIEANKNNKALILQFVQSPPLDTNITFKIKRGSKSLVFPSIAKAVQTPSFELEVGSALLAELRYDNSKLADPVACGAITVTSVPKNTPYLFSASIIKINNKKVKRKIISGSFRSGIIRREPPTDYRLSPGQYEIELKRPIFSGKKRKKKKLKLSYRAIKHSLKAKTLKLNVKPNMQYYIAIQYIANNISDNRDDDWKAVVWHESEGQCKFKTITK